VNDERLAKTYQTWRTIRANPKQNLKHVRLRQLEANNAGNSAKLSSPM
jgi:hypothetical protein